MTASSLTLGCESLNLATLDACLSGPLRVITAAAALCRVLSDINPVESVEFLRGRLERTEKNAVFLMTMNLA